MINFKAVEQKKQERYTAQRWICGVKDCMENIQMLITNHETGVTELVCKNHFFIRKDQLGLHYFKDLGVYLSDEEQKAKEPT